jgi:hypothetical protein
VHEIPTRHGLFASIELFKSKKKAIKQTQIRICLILRNEID